MSAEISLAKMLAVTAEITGTNMSEGAAEVMATELAAFPRQWIVGALKRCRHELKGRLSMAEVLARIDDGRPGPDEAFSMLPTSERETVVWTEEMAHCAHHRNPSNDPMTQRRAFTEDYMRRVTEARERGLPPAWSVSLGHDLKLRETPVAKAVQQGRITLQEAQDIGVMLPAPHAELLAIAGKATKSLTSSK